MNGPPMVMKYGVASPTDGKTLEETLRDMNPELALRQRVKLLEDKVAILTTCVEQLLEERKKRRGP